MKRNAGFDVGGTSTRLHLLDEDWNATSAAVTSTRELLDPQHLADRMVEMLGTARQTDPFSTLGCIGVGLAAQMSSDGEMVFQAPNLGWQDIPFASILRRALDDQFPDVPVRLVNDVNALLWAEKTVGAAADCDDVLACYVGTGIGGAITSGGHLITGAHGNGGEIGHAKVVVGGRLCGCGERGCLEAYAGGIHLERMVEELARDKNLLVFRSDGGVDLAKADALAEEDEDLRLIWDRATDHLAFVIANACSLLNPKMVLLGGGVLENLPFFRHACVQKISPLIPSVARRNLSFGRPTLGAESGSLGAALLAYEDSEFTVT
jgi:glucokinase